jgi:hypothetical protein
VEKLEVDANNEVVYVYLHDGAIINGKPVQQPGNVRLTENMDLIP